ncbi:MAG TPA: glycogen debranching protein GlgX [Candidatus Methylomirabilis sp.]|nr:glycogen debranching protein GlgX [Candidatus Methylomirabilis sp.]
MGYGLKHGTRRKVSVGRFYPLGASLEPGGANFALYSQNASEVFLLLFEAADGEPTDIIRLDNRTRYISHAFVHGVTAGQLYGFKVRGEFKPARGLRFNEAKLLIDPYAKALTGKAGNPDNLLLAYDAQSPDRDLSLDSRDNTAIVPKCIVVDDRFDWQGDTPSQTPLEDLVIYEVHLKGFTAHPSSKVASRGTYLGFIEKIPHLKELGINAVEFLPIHEHYAEDFLTAKGLTNYWAYNTIGFFAPESSYSTRRSPGCQVSEFKTLVRELHRAGIEVILDVVYNHSAEGNELGPTLSFKGIDNPTYYCLTGGPNDPARYYMNYTGCGNSLNLAHPHVIRFVMDSLRYWVEVMHVDGFRFDLASVLGREEGMFLRSASFFDAISQDPALNRVKLVAEPWDLGTYQVGNFPVDWSEWNGRFRDTLRRFGKGDAGQVPELGGRLTGSADLYADDGRSAYNSINFITCHDGFTLRDLVTYNDKHNEANLEGNRDGSNDNNSWNCGAEGETDDPAVIRLRRQQVKNFACFLLFAAGTPMILGGDECFRTQRGNNNAYCQDNEIGWFDWGEVERHRDILTFFRKAIALTRRYPVLQCRKFFTGRDSNGNGIPDIQWFGGNLGEPAWNDPELHTLCYMLDGGEESAAAGDYVLFVILNADFRPQHVRLPNLPSGKRWQRIIDTSLAAGEDFLDEGREVPIDPPGQYIANPRSTVLLLGK